MTVAFSFVSFDIKNHSKQDKITFFVKISILNYKNCITYNL